MNNSSHYEKPIPAQDYPLRLHIADAKSERPVHFPLHWHEHIELLYFPTGKTRVVIGKDTITAREGDLIVINGNELHSTERIENSTFYCIRIAHSFFSDVDFENVFFQSHIHNDKLIQETFEKIFAEYQTRLFGYDTQIKGLSYILITHLIRNYRLDKDEVLSKKKKLFKINAILRFISANYQNKLTTASLAKEFFMSESYLCHFFKNETGLSPMNYINKTRTEEAAKLLKSSEMSITEISLQVGFDDSNYFSKIFKRFMKVSPRDYKKE